MAPVVPSGNNKSISSNGKDGGNLATDFQQLVQNSPLALFTCDTKGKLTFHNSMAENLWGRPFKLGENVFGTDFGIFYPDGSPIPPDESPMAKAIEQNLPFLNQKIKIKRTNGSFKNLLCFSKPLYDNQNKLIGAQNTFVDVSQQQDEEIRRSTLSAIVKSSDDAIISKDLNGIINSWNAGAEKIFGYSEAEVVGKSITILIPKNRLKEETKILESIRNGKKVDHFETIRRSKNGKLIHISLTVSPIKDSMGRVIGASKIARNVTEQVEARAKIKKYIKDLEILNTVGKTISQNLDVQATLQRVTDSTTKLTGAEFGAFFYNNKDGIDDSFRLFTLSGASRETFEKLGMPRHTELFIPTFVHRKVIRINDVTEHLSYGKNFPNTGMPQGHLPVKSYLAVPVASKSNSVIGALLFGHPETNMFTEEHEKLVINIAAQAAIALDNSKLFEEVKSLSDKKDEFIALASHELKTPLTTIKGYLQVLSKKEREPLATKFLEKSLDQANKLNSLIEDLLNMSKIEAGKLELNLEPFDMRNMLLDIAEIFNHSHQNHKLTYSLGEAPAFIVGDKQRIEQAINNLLNNAVKYSPDANEVFLKLKITASHIQIIVIDKGIGLTDDQQSQLFTRFFRAENTKGISGLGLGLYLTKQIVDRHGGSIKVKSKLGEGSEFCLSLPLGQKKQTKISKP